jgi:methanogenic corrinoid protein MtbC1
MELFQKACGGIRMEANVLLEKAFGLGIRPLDLLMGMIQPLLYEIGNRYARGEITVTQEHLFSQFVDELIWRIRFRMQGGKVADPEKPEVLLVCANGNYHSLGIRFIELALIQEGISTSCLYPSLPAAEVVRLVESIRPKIIGVSIGDKNQLETVLTLASQLGKLPEQVRPLLIIGGFGATSLAPQDFGTKVMVHDGQVDSLIDLVRNLTRESVA